MTVSAGPAPDTVHVACHSRVEQDQPRYIASILLPVFSDGFRTFEPRFESQCHDQFFGIFGICVSNHRIKKLHQAAVRILYAVLYFQPF